MGTVDEIVMLEHELHELSKVQEHVETQLYQLDKQQKKVDTKLDESDKAYTETCKSWDQLVAKDIVEIELAQKLYRSLIEFLGKYDEAYMESIELDNARLLFNTQLTDIKDSMALIEKELAGYGQIIQFPTKENLQR